MKIFKLFTVLPLVIINIKKRHGYLFSKKNIMDICFLKKPSWIFVFYEIYMKNSTVEISIFMYHITSMQRWH
jgi:hypothetical protein